MSPELSAVHAKLDRILGIIQPPPPQTPMSIKEFADRVGLSRWTIQKRIKSRSIVHKGGRIPPSELKKFGL